jgi:hypothetical protein
MPIKGDLILNFKGLYLERKTVFGKPPPKKPNI